MDGAKVCLHDNFFSLQAKKDFVKIVIEILNHIVFSL